MARFTRADVPASLWPAVVLLALLAGVAAWLLWRGRQGPSEGGPLATALPSDYPRAPVEPPAPPTDEGDYVGSVACALCHQEIAAQYAQHPMWHTMVALPEQQPQETMGPQTAFQPGGRRSYRVELTDGQVLHHEAQLDAAGQTIYDQAVPIHYAVGSGLTGRTYLTDRGGLLFVSPVSWFSKPRQWDLSPGYSADDPWRFEVRATADCLFCHAGRLHELARGANRYHQPPVLEAAIGCERCHGPGRRHVALFTRGDASADADPLIVNPRRLDKPRQDDVCFQCHLQGKARVPRYGREVWDFRPGQSLQEVLIAYVNDPGVTAEGTTRAVSHVEQMLASRCYSASGGRLGCTSCHDPHSVPPHEARAEHYDRRCLVCHERHGCALSAEERSQPPALGSCVACHMPRRKARGFAHSSKTDHRIVRRAQTEGAEAPPTDSPDAWVAHERAERRLPRWEADRCRALAPLLATERAPVAGDYEQAVRLLSATTQVAPDDQLAGEMLGSALLELRRPRQARRACEAVLAREPLSEAGLNGAFWACAQIQDFQVGVAYGERLLAVNGWSARNWSQQARMLAGLGRRQGAISAAQRALELDPTLLELRQSLAGWLADEGRSAESQQQRELVRRLRGRPPGDL